MTSGKSIIQNCANNNNKTHELEPNTGDLARYGCRTEPTMQLRTDLVGGARTTATVFRTGSHWVPASPIQYIKRFAFLAQFSNQYRN